MARTTRTRTKKKTTRSTRKPTARRGTKAARSAAAKKAWRTRRRNAKRGGKKATSSSRRRPTKSRSTAAKRSAAARKAAKTRKANAAKRSRAAKKAAATRKRNSGKRKSSAKRKSTKRKGKGRTAASRRTAARKAAATRKRNAAKRSRAAKKAAATRKRNSRGGKRRSSKRRTSKRKSYKRRSTKKGKLSKMFTKKKFTASIMMGVGIVVTGALGLGLMGAVNNYGTQILSSTGILGYYSSALSAAGQYAGTVDFLVKMGVAGSVLAFGMSKLFGTKGLLSGAGKSAFGSNSAAVYGSTVAALALYGMSEVAKNQPIGAGLIQNLASGDVSAVAGRFKLMGGHNHNMSGYRRMYGHGNNHNLGMSRPSVNQMMNHGMKANNAQMMALNQNNSPMLVNQGAPNSGSNLFGTRKASRGRLNLF